MKKIIHGAGIITAVLCLFICSDNAFARSEKAIYQEGVRAAKAGDIDFAFMDFHELLRHSASSKYYPQALFSVGEYYYWHGNRRDAEMIFTDFIEKFPDSEAFPFAMVYLLQFWKDSPDEEFAYELKKKIIKFKQLSLLFSEFKEYSFTSSMNYNYRAVYFIDRVEFYINDELFERIYF